MSLTISRPAPDEYAPFYRGYIAAVETDSNIVETLERQRATIATLGRLTAGQASHRYAEGKWSVKEVIGHMADTERVFSYRLLRIARGDQTPLPGFDEQRFGAAAGADARALAELVDEFVAVRMATLPLVRALDDATLGNRTVVNGQELSARALVFIIAGHVRHHLNVLRDRYGVNV